jgi:hypothetical protein
MRKIVPFTTASKKNNKISQVPVAHCCTYKARQGRSQFEPAQEIDCETVS